MSFLEEKDKEYLEKIMEDIGTWPNDTEEHYYKDGEEISTPTEDGDPSITQKTVFYDEDGKKKYEINSNGKNTQILEFDDDGEEVEKFVLDEAQMFELFGIK